MRKRAQTKRIPLDRRIAVHDRLQFELKLEYQPSPKEKKSKYLVECFIFMPASLNVGPETVPAEDLYSDIHNYVRLKTPELSWYEFGALPTSPLVRAEEEARGLRSLPTGDPTRFIFECKRVATVFRRSLREILDRIDSALEVDDMGRLAEEVDETLDHAFSIATQFRKIEEVLGGTPIQADAAFRLADEYLSLAVEQTARRALVILDKVPKVQKEVRLRLLDAILAEEKYRTARSYPSILDPAGDNEDYVHRAGILKKYCSSALFLHIRRFAARRQWREILFAVSAGIAMAFATVVAFWAQARTGMLGMRLFIVLVVAYMFKDRLKDGMRSLFARFLERHFFDRNIVIDDPAGGTLGFCREKIQYIPIRRLDEKVKRTRSRAGDPSIRAAEEELNETVYHYKKQIVLFSKRLYGRHDSLGVTDIMRFHVGRLLRDMDEPYHVIDWIDHETLRLGPVRAAKVYHVDVVFRFRAHRDQAPAMTCVRLVLDRRGIKRIERGAS